MSGSKIQIDNERKMAIAADGGRGNRLVIITRHKVSWEAAVKHAYAGNLYR